MKNRRAGQRVIALLIGVLLLPLPSPAQAMADDMFSVMFRMMLVMANVMSNAMLGNNNNWGNNGGGLNSFNMGMSGYGAPMNSFGGGPWNSFGGTPWNSYASPWGGSPWSSYGYSPWGGTPWDSYGYSPWDAQANWQEVPPPNSTITLLEGRWFGQSGEVLEISGERFLLRADGGSLGGSVRIKGNIMNMYSPQTNTLTRYTFMYNPSELVLNDGRGVLLTFRKHPADVVHVY
ncbi:MAG: hypothetical protein WBO34_03370 [Gammaproteobacteria bacterium]